MNTLFDLIGALLYILVFPIIVVVNCCIELAVALKYVKTAARKAFVLGIKQVHALPSYLHRLDIGKLFHWRTFHR